MSWWTNARDSVTGTVAPIVNTATGGLIGNLGGMFGLGGAGGLLGMLGGGASTGGLGGFGTSLGGTLSTTGTDTGQYGSLMDMLGQRYQQPTVGQTGTPNLNNQGLI